MWHIIVSLEVDVVAADADLRARDIEVVTDDIEPCGHDEMMDLYPPAGFVARPRSTPDVQEILRVASRDSIAKNTIASIRSTSRALVRA